MLFQSKLPRRERQFKVGQVTVTDPFQSTLPQRERPQGDAPGTYVFDGFNPRSHEGSDSETRGTDPSLMKRVSIHAPTKGATRHLTTIYPSISVSIHAPTKGATKSEVRSYREEMFQSTLPRRERRCSGVFPTVSTRFNPRSHEGSDDTATHPETGYPYVSIHAPTKGATAN